MSSDEDTRINCKYGVDCYQKNSSHHEKYKHPSKKRQLPLAENETSKKQKLDTDIQNEQISESDDDDLIFKLSVEEEEMHLRISIDDDTPKMFDVQREVISNSEDDSSNHSKSEAKKQISNEDIERAALIKEQSKKEKSPQQLEPLLSLESKKNFIKETYLVDMPPDFYDFWEFCKSLNSRYPKEAFKSVGLILVGPYDILEDSFKYKVDDDKFLMHWRYYYDPPEFQTIIKGNDFTGFHMGYFRDTPDTLPVFVGSNQAKKDCTIEQIGENIFGAINTHLDTQSKTADPFKKIAITKLQKAIETRAKLLNLDLTKVTPKMQTRHHKQICKTFHNAGIVVPYNRSTTVGYRKLPVDDKQLRKLLDRVSICFPDIGNNAFAGLQPILTAATIANDECDFGTALELGINIFCYGHPCFNNTVLRLLKTTYTLLQRKQFADICELHINNRMKEKPYIADLF